MEQDMVVVVVLVQELEQGMAVVVALVLVLGMELV